MSMRLVEYVSGTSRVLPTVFAGGGSKMRVCDLQMPPALACTPSGNSSVFRYLAQQSQNAGVL